MHENALKLKTQDVNPADVQAIISLYKRFEQYKDNTEEELYVHILPSLKLKQYRIHKDKDELIGFTNWAYLSDKVQNDYLKTGIIEPLISTWNSGNNLWHIDTVCVKNINKIMNWTKKYFTEKFGVGHSINWLRINNNSKKVLRVSTKFTKGSWI